MIGRHFAFFTFPRFGHVRPTLATVRELVGRGHRVSYVVPADYAAAVASAGAAPVPYPSTFPPVLPPPRTGDELAEALAHFLRESLAALPVAWPALADAGVDAVVEDALSTVTSRLVAARAGCPVVTVFAGLAGNEQVALNGSEGGPDAPRLDPTHPVLIRAERDLAATVTGLGFEPDDVERTVATTVPSANLVYVPRSFQPGAEHFDERFAFVGPELPGPVRGHWRPPAGRRVALVSLGTCAPSNPQFFRECAAAFADTDWHLVMTTGGHLDPIHAGALPGSVELHSFLDHSEVLPHAEIQVCQAGAGSLMDAFSHGVPVVAVPQHPDSAVVARHVDSLGLGRALFTEITGPVLRAAVDEVTTSELTARRVRAMQADIAAAGGARRASLTLEDLVAR